MSVALAFTCLTPVPALAEDRPPTPSREALMQLGREFAKKIGARLKEADLFLSGAGKLELAQQKSGTQVPDNEPLLFQGITKNRVFLKQEIYAVKRGNRMMISLGDFCSAADFAISVHPDKGTAAGWFTRENQTFVLDAKKGEVTIMGETAKVAADQIEMDGGDLLVSATSIEKWFGLDFNYNFSALRLIIASQQPLPVEEAYQRSHARKGGGGFRIPESTLPLEKTPYAMVALPYIDTTLSSRTSYAPGVPTGTTMNWSTILSGDLAGFNAQSFISGSATRSGDRGTFQPLTSFRLTMGREDPEGGLLGPLNARKYQFGDVNTVPLSMIDGGRQELGAMVTNKPSNSVSVDTTTDLRGDVQPGWDVELYRNDSLVTIARAGADGQYFFEKVPLQAGDNDFKLLFYGPQGEIREEHKHVLTNPFQLVNQAPYYAVSATLKDRAVYQENPPGGRGAGSPHLAASYQRGLGTFGTLSFGARHGSDAGIDRTFVQSGIATSAFDTFLNADVGYSLNDAASTVQLTARRTIGKQAAQMQYTWYDKNYNISAPPSVLPPLAASAAPFREMLSASLGGPLPGNFAALGRPSYDLSASQTRLYNGGTLSQYGAGLTARVGSISLAGGINQNNSDTPSGGSSFTGANFSARGFLYGGFWRVGTAYTLRPETALQDVTAEYDYYFNEKLSSTVEARYFPDPSLTEGSLSLNWHTSKALVSPNVSVNSKHNVTAGVNVHFGMGAEPYKRDYHMYDKYLSSAGGVAARIFLDKNGDGLYTPGDELMPDVVLKSQQTQVRARSDEDGIAFIPNLEQNRVTDIVVDPSTFRDSYNTSLFPGVSVLPRPGVVAQVEFPVVVSGEIDGQGDYIKEDGSRISARGMRVTLVAPDGKVEKSVVAAYDGYYSMSTIRPGVYYQVFTADETLPGHVLPKMAVFKADGTTSFGESVTIPAGPALPYRFASVNAAPVGKRGTRVITPQDIASREVLIDLGEFRSHLGMAFAWYRFKLRSPEWHQNLALVTPLSDIKPDPKTGRMRLTVKPRTPLTLETATDACISLQAQGYECGVALITTYRDMGQAAETRDKPKKSDKT